MNAEKRKKGKEEEDRRVEGRMNAEIEKRKEKKKDKEETKELMLRRGRRAR